MQKIVIVMPCWKRSEIVDLVARQLDILFRDTKQIIDLSVVYVFSMEDPELDQLFSIYLKANHHRDFVFSSNKLLGKKLNDGIQYAAKYKYDYIMNFGSDDLMHADIFKLYADALTRNCDIIGINKVFFYNQVSNPVLFSYYNQPNLVGAGRLIHRRVIDSVFMNFNGLYKDDLCSGMDTFSAHRMRMCGHMQTMVDPGEFPYIVDIKSDVNINSFDKIVDEATTGSLKEFQIDYITSHYSELYAR
jgi:hypothetical protein